MSRSPGAKPRVGVVGTGYVGLVTAASFAQLGFRVTCLDVDKAKIARLRAGDVPFFEPGLAEAIVRSGRRLSFTSRPQTLYGRSPIVFVCVDTPPLPDGSADLSRVESVVGSIPRESTPLLVMKSTVPVGTGSRILQLLHARGRPDIGYVSNPEFLREGTAMRDVAQPDRIVIGGFDQADIDRVADLYAQVPAPIVRTDTPSAEMIKYASNAFLATKITFINEVANVCEGVGANVDTVALGMGLDHRIGTSFLRPGIGYGGSCFGKDMSALASLSAAVGYQFETIESVQRVNRRQKLVAIQKLRRHLGDLGGARIALLGLSFKAHTSDMRDAPSVDLARALMREGARVSAFDPIVGDGASAVLPGVAIAADIRQATAGADAVVIITEWPEFHAVLDPSVAAAMRYPLLIDGRNLLSPESARAAGYIYDSVGRSSATAVATCLPTKQAA